MPLPRAPLRNVDLATRQMAYRLPHATHTGERGLVVQALLHPYRQFGHKIVHAGLRGRCLVVFIAVHARV